MWSPKCIWGPAARPRVGFCRSVGGRPGHARSDACYAACVAKEISVRELRKPHCRRDCGCAGWREAVADRQPAAGRRHCSARARAQPVGACAGTAIDRGGSRCRRVEHGIATEVEAVEESALAQDRHPRGEVGRLYIRDEASLEALAETFLDGDELVGTCPTSRTFAACWSMACDPGDRGHVGVHRARSGSAPRRFARRDRCIGGLCG
jgi:hypothetical protein